MSGRVQVRIPTLHLDEEITSTNATTALAEPAGNGGDVDALRQMPQFMAQLWVGDRELALGQQHGCSLGM